MPPFAHIPSRRFRNEEDEANDDDGGQHRRSHHKPPIETSHARRVSDLIQCDIGYIAQHNAERGPHLPLHDESTADGLRCSFGAVDGHRGGFGTNPKPECETSDEHVPPGIGEGLPETGEGREDTGDEDCAPTSEVVVERNGQPASDESTAEIGCRVDQAQEPCGARVLAIYAELRGVEQLTTVDDGLICGSCQFGRLAASTRPSHTHSLDSSTCGTDSNHPVHELGLGPLVRELLIPDSNLLRGHALNGLEPLKILSEDGTVLKGP